jgi:hypothetical protein
VAQIRTPVPPAGDDDTELLAVVTPARRAPATRLTVIGAAILGLAVVAGIIVSVLTMSDESARPVPQAPLTPISIPARTVTTTPQASTSDAQPAPSYAPLPPITATAQTMTTAPLLPVAPTDGSRVRDRLHDLFPRLFPETP